MNLTKTIIRFQIFLISNLNQPGTPKNHHIINTFTEALNNDVDELIKANKLYHVITFHNMKRAL